MSDEYAPGFYDRNGSALARVDQQRSEAREALRKATAISLTYVNPDSTSTHWAVYDREDGDAFAFLLYALCRAWRDVEDVGMPREKVAEIVAAALEGGIGI